MFGETTSSSHEADPCASDRAWVERSGPLVTLILVIILPAQGRAEIETADWRLSAEDRQAAFARLVEAHHADLVRLAYLICGDRELAADVAQSTWQAAWAQLEKLRDPGAARAWLLSITANQARRQIRRLALRRVLEPRSLAWSRHAHATGQDPDLDVDLAAALAKLDPHDRQLIALRYAIGLTSEEIGPMVKLSASGVRVRLGRLRERLRRELTDG
jgi:RNA polymerase sigma-70 factor (ECF subfamily)